MTANSHPAITRWSFEELNLIKHFSSVFVSHLVVSILFFARVIFPEAVSSPLSGKLGAK